MWKAGSDAPFIPGQDFILIPRNARPSPSQTLLSNSLPSSSHTPSLLHPANQPHTDEFPRHQTDKRTMLENYDLVSLAVDEIVDDGIVLETDPITISQRVSKPPVNEVAGVKGLDLSEQGISNLIDFGRRTLADRLRQGLN